MQNSFFRAICSVGIFMICAQAIIHFRPQEAYEKYLKLLVSLMVLIQLFLPIGSFLLGGGKQEAAGLLEDFQQELERGMKEAGARAEEADAILGQMTLEEVRKRLEEGGESGAEGGENPGEHDNGQNGGNGGITGQQDRSLEEADTDGIAQEEETGFGQKNGEETGFGRENFGQEGGEKASFGQESKEKTNFGQESRGEADFGQENGKETELRQESREDDDGGIVIKVDPVEPVEPISAGP